MRTTPPLRMIFFVAADSGAIVPVDFALLADLISTDEATYEINAVLDGYVR